MWILQAIRSGSYLQLLVGLAARAIVIFLILPVHEYAHGWAAAKLGDPTAQARGRRTFNPLAHLDPIGALCILLFSFGWAKPVPVNPMYFRHRKRDMALTALAGPASNLLVALLAALIYNVIWLLHPAASVLQWINYFFYYFIVINISLAVFNLLPIPPLDGSRIFAAILPERWSWTVARYERIIFLVLAVLVFSGALDPVLSTLNQWAFDGVMAVADLPFRLFGLL